MRLFLPIACWLIIGTQFLTSQTGPDTEKRFPPLRVPAGFKATLFACDPLIEYPSVIAAGPKPHSLIVAIDYVAGIGGDIVRRSEIRLIDDTNADGYADQAIVYATGFNSIQGLAYHQGTVFVMHAPLLSALKDTDGDGKADLRTDLFNGLGLPPEKNPSRLHCANGVVAGHDGWLYLAEGDNGIGVARPEGDRLVLNGGGILRCRPDGKDLHLFATGLRNIYDVALDDDLNVFVRDNENDGGTYKNRVYFSFHGADHGYPYLYDERPDETLLPLADLGLGSSAGGICYRETAFPPEYRGNLFFCEWGRAVMRYPLQRAGSGFAPVKEIEFAAGAPNDPYGFKPTDLVVQRDGALYISDWGDGQRPNRGRGRIYRVTPTTTASPLAFDHGLVSHSYAERVDAQHDIERHGEGGLFQIKVALARSDAPVRTRLHAVWIIAHLQGANALPTLFDVIQKDADARVRLQAVRAVADLTDPMLVQHRLDAGAGDAKMAEQLAMLAKDQDPAVIREIIIALGRLRWAGLADWLKQVKIPADKALDHAAMQALRRSGNWLALLKLLDEPGPWRNVALRALADQHQPAIVDGLIERLGDARWYREYADLLTRVHQKPGPWVYWGYRPGPRPANSVRWERSDAIEQALDQLLVKAEPATQLAVLRRMQREKVPLRFDTLAAWLRRDRELQTATAILDALRDFPAPQRRELLEQVIHDKAYGEAPRQAALAMWLTDPASETRLLALAATLEEGVVLAQLVGQLGQKPGLKAATYLQAKVRSPNARVRAAATEALAELRVASAGDAILPLLSDADAGVRQSAATAMGKLEVRSAGDALLKMAQDSDPGVRRACLESLRLLKEPRVVPLATAALGDSATRTVALTCLHDLGGPGQAATVVDLVRRQPSADMLLLAVKALTRWQDDRAVAEVQGTSGMVLRWRLAGPLPPERLDQLVKEEGAATDPIVFAVGNDARVTAKSDAQGSWLARAELLVPTATPVQFLSASNGTLRIWLNGKQIYARNNVRPFQLDSDRFEASLEKGLNQLIILVTPAAKSKGPEFQVRFRRKSQQAEHEQLIQAALSRGGNAERGRHLFFNAEKSQCIKCHRLGEQGERLGPELTGIGGRFSRIHIVESILEPSRSIGPNFETLVVSLKDGKVLTGIRLAETADMLTLGDNQGQKLVIAKKSIDERGVSPQSTMPEGLEKRLSVDEFVDLIAFLVGQR